MARNVEIKARVLDLDDVRARARTLAPQPSEILKHTDTFFVVPDGRLKTREFGDGSGELIFYKRRDEPGPKESDYKRVGCGDAKAMLEILANVLPVRGTVVKEREVFLVGRTRIHLDRVQSLGFFLELEVVLDEQETVVDGQHVADQLLRALEIQKSALICTAYIDLLEQLRSQ